MSIIIKDIEMPNGCGDCPFCSCVANDKGRAEFQCDIFFVYSAEVIYVTDIIAKGEIPSFCPLVEAPVVHGKWEEFVLPLGDREYSCSECGFCALYKELTVDQVCSEYCPNCGAKMDGE